MLDRNKNKLKIQINKALQTVNNIIKPTSDIKQTLENTYKDINVEKTDKVHDTIMDTQAGQQFITCEYNKDPKSNNYRSPYTNRYYPIHNEEAFMPSPLLRDLEDKGNLLFSEYARLYYGEEGCIPNFYVYETQQGLNFAFFVKKIHKDQKSLSVWCSSNLIQIRGDPSKSVSYKLQTTVVYQLNILDQSTQQLMEIYGSVKKHRVQTKRWSPQYEMDEFHLLMAGKLVEQVETHLRQQIQCVFLAKTKDIIFKTRFANTKEQENQKKKMGAQIAKMRSENLRTVT